MDYPEKRRAYLQNFEIVANLVQLSKVFITSLENHRTFGFYMETIQNRSEERIKDFILLEMTLTRSNCNEIIRLLQESGQTNAAKLLDEYNTSPGRMALSYDICIPVNASDSPMVGSGPYDMTRNPRGKAIIINNVPAHLFSESKRFEHIFKELMFSVESYFGLTAVEMIKTVEQIKANMELSAKLNRRNVKNMSPQALIVMIITHGINDKILGRDGCKALENFDVIIDDHVEISTIVNLFSDSNFSLMKKLPKIFFFTCCRDKINVDEIPENIIDEIDKDEDNRDTFVCYSCSEGYKTFYNEDNQISHFGQVLSHSIAQYANQSDLNAIITRANNWILELTEESNVEKGHFASEIRTKGLRRELFFNPKWSEN